MQLRVTDTILIGSISNEALRPGQMVEVDDAEGTALLKSHPGFFARSGAKGGKKAIEGAPANKATTAPEDKSAQTKGNGE